MDFIISDLHHSHSNIIRYEQRPFKNVIEMNEYISNNWNSVVTDRDRVFVLGDVMFSHNEKEVIEFLNSLNGKIIIVYGNHDKPLTKLFFQCRFRNSKEKIYIAPPIYEPKVIIGEEDGGKYEKVFLSHYPTFSWNGKYHGRKHFYGHVHTGDEWHDFRKLGIKNAYNVTVEILDYTPHTFRDVMEINDMVGK